MKELEFRQVLNVADHAMLLVDIVRFISFLGDLHRNLLHNKLEEVGLSGEKITTEDIKFMITKATRLLGLPLDSLHNEINKLHLLPNKPQNKDSTTKAH